MRKTEQRPRHTAEPHPEGFVVVDWCQGRAVSEPLPRREFAAGRAEQLNRMERAA